ncbi:dTDP-4-dehydrorhamnose reductase [Dietzia sp. 2505]|uniref:dTDP-4-dehydrorhamnose reductase n=1 Tax=Dietzia sp. 2505 TaxID=3156457 RepID=UPI00339556B9
MHARLSSGARGSASGGADAEGAREPFRPAGLPRILVTGGGGQLGRALSRVADAPARTELDLTAPDSIAATLDRYAPEVVINAAAYTDVDGAEADEAGARAVNTDGVRDLAVACRDRGIRLLHISTDYVFSGAIPEGSDPATARGLEPTDATEPVTVYGRTKLAGERAALEVYPETTVVRTAWLYTGPWRVLDEIPGSDFVATMIRLESQRDTIEVVDDQWGSPTSVGSLSEQLLCLLSAEKGGTVDRRGQTHHATGGGRATWFELARTVFRQLGADPERVRPCTSEQFPRPAPRPEFSVLADRTWRELGLSPTRDWRRDLVPGMSYLVSTRDWATRPEGHTSSSEPHRPAPEGDAPR